MFVFLPDAARDAVMDSDRDAHHAILRVIEDETAAYFNKDYKGWARCWVQAPYARRMGWYARGGVLVQSGEQDAAAMKLAMEKFPVPNRSAHEVRRENANIRVSGKMAWVTFEQIAPKTGDPFDVPGRQHEARILEKHAGEWKIACCFVLGSLLEFTSHPLLRVDERSAVVWMNDAATQQIGHHDHLTLIGGRLRAHNRATDQRLQASIRWAAGVEGYFARQTALSVFPGKYGALPIVLGEKGEAVVEICWVIAEAGMILV
jgi:Domain of unknown function (DUF4440)